MIAVVQIHTMLRERSMTDADWSRVNAVTRRFLLRTGIVFRDRNIRQPKFNAPTFCAVVFQKRFFNDRRPEGLPAFLGMRF